MVYPRVCGGTGAYGRGRGTPGGLSPRVRGNPSTSSRASARAGSIPACAGEPVTAQVKATRFTVYPRVCGGTFVPCSPTMTLKGLSPRVRGNHRRRYISGRDRRSIPACAGEPRMPIISAISFRVYPRVCGGTQSPFNAVFRLWGLSPRVRGNRTDRDAQIGSNRSIPACAGEPPLGRAVAVGRTVYPRVCGGTRTSAGIRR